jgi:hypothetical protein
MDIITNFAAGEEAVGAIFDGDQDKGKHKEEDPVGSSWSSKRNNRKKKKNQQGKLKAPADDLVAAADCKKPRGPPAGAFLTKCSKSQQAVLFFTDIVHRFGVPNCIITDNGT